VKVVREEATAEGLRAAGFGAVIIATGATPLALEDVCGIDDEKVVTASQVLHDEVELGRKVAIIGGGIVGTEAGLVVAEQGKQVVFVEMLDTFMNNITVDEKQVYELRFENLDIAVHTGQRLEAVTEEGIRIVDRFGRRTDIAVDTVVLAAGFRPDRALAEELRMTLPDLQVLEAGDCVRPRKIFDAIHEGHLAAKLLG